MQPQRRPLNTGLFTALVLVGLLPTIGKVVAEERPTNLAALRSLARQLAAQVVAEAGASQVLLLKELPAHAADWLVEEELLRVAREEGVVVYLLPDSASLRKLATPTDAAMVRFRVVAAGVRYERLRGGLFRTARLRRTVFLHAHVVASTREGRLLWSRDFRREAEDEVPLREVPRLEERDMPLTQGQVPPPRGAQLVEPVLVLVVTGVITYLFYAYRSK
jgi:hypothetical protein